MSEQENKSDNTEVYKALDKIDQDVLLDYVWETPGLVDTIKEWLEEDYTPNWSDRDWHHISCITGFIIRMAIGSALMVDVKQNVIQENIKGHGPIRYV